MKPLVLCCLLGAAVLSGCVPFPSIERSRTLTNEEASSIVGENANVTLTDSVEHEARILEITADSVVLNCADSTLCLPRTNVESILIKGSIWGRFIGSLAGYAVALGAMSSGPKGANFLGGGRGRDEATEVLVGIVGIVGFVGMPIIGEYAFTPDWRYIVTPGRSAEPADSAIQETKRWNGTNPQYVLTVEQFVVETESTVTIVWQGKAVTLPKSEITIEKFEGGIRIKVPARLLK